MKRFTARLLSVVLASSAAFLFFSLVTYHAADATWFSYSSVANGYHNLFGAFGAQLSAVQLYWLGSVASVVASMLLSWCAYRLWQEQTLAEHWERLVAGVFLLVSVAGMSTSLRFEPILNIQAGGRIGRALVAFMGTVFGTSFAYSALVILFLIALVVTTRLVFVPVCTACVRACVRLPLWAYMYRAGVYALRYVGSFLLSLINRLRGRSQEQVALTGLNGERPLVGALRDTVDNCDELQDAADYAQMADHDGSLDDEELFSEDEQKAQLSVDESLSVNENANASGHVLQAGGRSAATQRPAVHVVSPTAAVHVPYTLPDTSLFIGVKEEKDNAQIKHEMQERAQLLEEKLRRFGIEGSVVAIKRGPVVTLFEYKPAIDTKLSKILALEDDLSLALQAMSIRILAPIPGTNVVGFEVANTLRRDVSFAGLVKSAHFKNYKGSLPLILGEDTIGEPVVIDLARTPHLLIAGSTGSGKSVGLNGMLMSLVCRLSPDELKLILIDPKRLEFAAYADIAHLLFPIITHPKKATMALRWVVKEMERRYEAIAASGARNLFDYNEQMVTQGTDKLPFIVVVVDELADLMMTAGRECEDLITRITQMARAAGIHLLVATQRPSVDIITGLIKVNFPSRISFRVTSKIDSRTILDCSGADKLLGRGDMLFLDATTSQLRRVHGAYVSDKEIQAVVAHIKAERAPEYLSVEALQEGKQEALPGSDDAIYEEVLQFLSTVEEISISLLQRRFRIGYNRSARIIDMLESQGFIMSSDSGKTRKVVRG
jgi:S-DNA-T family DNA segregation ATPase FtsK/SpoIIIE